MSKDTRCFVFETQCTRVVGGDEPERSRDVARSVQIHCNGAVREPPPGEVISFAKCLTTARAAAPLFSSTIGVMEMRGRCRGSICW